jgi:hypothetical protein
MMSVSPEREVLMSFQVITFLYWKSSRGQFLVVGHIP